MNKVTGVQVGMIFCGPCVLSFRAINIEGA